MPSTLHKRPARNRYGLKTLSAAVVSALVFSNAYAAGLGKLTVLSPLGQPLRAEIELTSVSKDEAGNLVARLAAPEAFQQANIEYTSVLRSLQFAVDQRGDRQFIRVTSTQPLNEPFVDMLLELNGPSGRLVREYTFLLDPPNLRSSQSAQVAPVVPAQTQRAREAASAGTAQQRAERSAPASAAAAQQQYQVRDGDTLAKVAGQVKPSGISLDQMLVALYRNNPDAFTGQNMNRLRAGQILNVPDAEAARSVGAGEARRIVMAQSADFRSYRTKLAEQVENAGGQSTSAARQAAGGKITTQVEERATPASESRDKLQLSNAATSAVSAEDLIAKDKALAEANARVKELERNVSELQKLLEVKSKNLAAQQQQADASNASPSVAVPAGAASSTTDAASKIPAAPEGAAAAASPAAQAEAGSAQPAAQQPAAAPEEEKPAAPPVAAAPAKPAAPAPAPAPEEPSFIDGLLDNPLVLPGLGALLVGLGGLGIFRARRQKKQSKQFEDSLITDSNLKANSLFGSTGGQSVDTNNSVFSSSFSPSASQLDTNEVDPVAEADVYIAYGRDAQAEEILKEALRTQPERHAIRVKLLEIYSNRKDVRAFEVLATELYGMTKGEGEEWAQAAAMGAAIDPNNPLYGGAKPVNAAALGGGAAVAAAAAPALDEQGLATLLAETKADIGNSDADRPFDAETSFFSNTSPADDVQADPHADVAGVEPDAPAAQGTSNDLDFDLGGMNLHDVAVPNTIPRPVPAEPAANLASIDFNFLDEPSPAPAASAETAQQAADDVALPQSTQQHAGLPGDAPIQSEPVEIPEVKDLDFSFKDDASLNLPPLAFGAGTDDKSDQPAMRTAAGAAAYDFGASGLDEMPAQAAKQEPASVSPLDFDLSGISLELDSNDTRTSFALDFGLSDLGAAGDASASAVAEMATKLDLAIAYQEIGDKEGARELLDEVLKGGTPEQSERAKTLLLELA